MTLRTLIRRSLRFHWRSHLGVVLGAAIGSAALIGALVVGDSVKWSLRERALERLGKIQEALVSPDRFFRSELASDLQYITANKQFSAEPPGQFVALLQLPAAISTLESESRVNDANLIGIESNFSVIAKSDRFLNIPSDGVLLNEPLAEQLSVRRGDWILIRVQKPSALSHEASISPRSDSTVAIRLQVLEVVPASALGNLDFNSGVGLPLNAFVALDVIQRQLGSNQTANIILNSDWSSTAPEANLIGRAANGLGGLRRLPLVDRFASWAIEGWGSRPVGLGGSPSTKLLNGLDLPNVWKLADAECLLQIPPNCTFAELRSPRIFLDPPIIRAALAADPNAQPILTYLATLLRAGTNAAPYSMVTAAGSPWTPVDLRDDEIVVSQWLAEDLRVKPGDAIAVNYFLPESGAKLEEATNTFRVHSIVAMEMPWADRTLMPDFPGIEKAESTSEWDAGFPLTYDIRKKDDDYWKQHRGTPKAFITLAAGQKMWGNRFGNLTAIRFPIPTNNAGSTSPHVVAYKEALEKKILANIKPEELGLRFEPVREQALKAAEGSQDFGGLFLGFSFFVIGAALLLMAMLFQFSLEQRAPEVGTLLALGFTPAQVRKLFLREGVVLTFIGGVIGAVGGIYYAKAMLHGLNTAWSDAVGGTALSFHVTTQTLAIGVFASVVVSSITIWFALRKFVKRSPRELLAGDIGSEAFLVSSFKFQVVGIVAALAATGLCGWAVVSGDLSNAGIFFGAGALVLLAGLSFANAWLGRLGGGDSITLMSIAVHGCARRRKRSLATIAMLACGSFLIVSIGVFRLDANRDATQKTSGTGGFALMGKTTIPVVHDLNSQSGREFFALDEKDLADVNVVPFRVRAGDEASCLNLNAAQKPKLLGVKPGMLEGRFTFAKGSTWKALINTRLQPGASAAEKQKNRLSGFSAPIEANTGLKPGVNEIEIPAIGDANSIQWAMKKKIGDTIDYVDERGQPFKVRIVGAVANSILQGQLIIDEAEFVKRFPGESGYRMFLMDAPSNAVSQVSATLSQAMQDVGLELTPTAARLNQFNAVQNTYLGTFQVLGGLGLLLGSVGLGIVVLRNVLERRGELAVLMAVGFRKGQVQRLLLIENGALLLAGLALGIIAAAVAVLPALLSANGGLPVMSLAITLGAVLVNGALWTWAATRFAVRGDLLKALRNE